MQGIIAKWVPANHYGFARSPDGTEYFCPQSSLPAGHNPQEGDEFEFEFDAPPQPGKKPKVRSGARFIGAGRPIPQIQASAPQPATVRAGNAALVATLSVTIRPGVTLELGGKKVLPVMVEVRHGSVVVPDKAVELLKNDKKACKPSVVNTKGDGIATFLVPVEENESAAKLTAKVGAGSFTEIWERDKPTAQAEQKKPETPKICKVIKAEVLMSKPGFSDSLKVKTLSEDRPDAGIKTQFSIQAADAITARIGTIEKTGLSVEFETNDTGEAVVKVEFTPPNTRGDIFIASVTNPQLQSGPHYIRRPR
jgi:hypothetical protein